MLQTVILYVEYYFIMLSVIKLIAVMPDASFLIAIFLIVILLRCHHAECRYAECRGAVCEAALQVGALSRSLAMFRGN